MFEASVFTEIRDVIQYSRVYNIRMMDLVICNPSTNLHRPLGLQNIYSFGFYLYSQGNYTKLTFAETKFFPIEFSLISECFLFQPKESIHYVLEKAEDRFLNKLKKHCG